MSECLRLTSLSALRQGDALLAWVLLGWLGQRLGWSAASGVLPVVVWWAVRSGATALGMHGAWPGVWLWAWGAGVLGLLALPTLLPAGPAALGVLLLSAAAWGAWSASLARVAGDTSPTLPGQAMGLMMGSLWLSSQWCLGPGWTDTQAVTLHIGLMAGMPLLVAVSWRRAPVCLHASPRQATVLLAAGALLMAWPETRDWRLAGMVLLVLAWSLAAQGLRQGHSTLMTVPTGVGPALLLGAGLLAPTQGPAALQWAWWVVAALALASMCTRRPNRPQIPVNTQRWSDAS